MEHSTPDMFLDRVRVGIADTRKSGVAVINDPRAAATEMILQEYPDIPDNAREILKNIGYLSEFTVLAAFWETYGSHLKIPRVRSRLWINPPSNIIVHDGSNNFTLRTRSIFNGKYGPLLDLVGPSALQTTRIEGDVVGYFDDVSVFWDEGANISSVVDYVCPGSTLTLYRPVLPKHQFWIGWSGFNLDMHTIQKTICSQYHLRLLDERSDGDICTSMFGVESL